MESLNEKADEKIIQDYADEYKQKIPEQLNTPVQTGSGKYNISVQQKTGGKTDQKGYNKRSDMRFEGNKSQMKDLLM